MQNKKESAVANSFLWSECRDSNPKQCMHCLRRMPHSLSAARKPLGDGNQEASGSYKKAGIHERFLLLVGVSGFEPEASWTRTKRDTKLRHTPITTILY